MTRHIPCSRFGLTLLLVGLIFGGLVLAGMPAQAGNDGPRCAVSAPLLSPVMVEDAAAMSGDTYTRYFPLWYNDTRKTRP